MSKPLPDVEQEAIRLLNRADEQRVVLRLLGGTAIKMTSPSSRDGLPLGRPAAQDLDLAGLGPQGKKIKELFIELGYEPDKRFNALHGRTRLQFIDSVNGRVNDVFLDVFNMCHNLDLKHRLLLGKRTLPLADLLLTKLQVVNLNEKDLKDAMCVIMDHKLGNTDAEESLNLDYLTKLCCDDWGLCKTTLTSLDAALKSVDNYSLRAEQQVELKTKIAKIVQAIETRPKSLRWKARAIVGEKAAYYNVVEAPVRVAGEEYEKKASG